MNKKRGFSSISNKDKKGASEVNNKPYTISPIKIKQGVLMKNFSTMDIETISLKDFDNIQLPVIISITFNLKSSFLIEIDREKLKKFYKEKNLLAMNNLVGEMWRRFIVYIKTKNMETIFVHNLGKFDGIFLYHGLLKAVDNIKNINTIIDNKNSFISISYSFKKEGKMKTIVWKDSLRIFPVSLEELCKIFMVEGKISKYNLAFNDISLSPKEREQ